MLFLFNACYHQIEDSFLLSSIGPLPCPVMCLIDDFHNYLEMFMAYETKITLSGRSFVYCRKDHGMKVNLKIRPQ